MALNDCKVDLIDWACHGQRGQFDVFSPIRGSRVFSETAQSDGGVLDLSLRCSLFFSFRFPPRDVDVRVPSRSSGSVRSQGPGASRSSPSI